MQVRIVRANLLYIEKKDLPSAMLNRLLRLGAFQNPEFYKAQAMRLPTFNKPRVIACGEELANHISLPRGCLVEVIELLKTRRIKPEVSDERFVGRPIEVGFYGRLRPLQQDAVDAFVQHDEGILCAPTAFGKTAVAAWLIAARNLNTLVLVHRQQLLDQWHARLAMFVNLPAKSIGQIGGGTTKRSGCVDIAILQSSHDKEGVKDFVAEYGQVIVDECHHLSAFTFEQVMKQVKAKYIVGLTATPERKDGHQPIIYMQCGPIRFKLSARSMTAATPFEHEVVPRLTDFSLPPEQTDMTMQEVYAAIADDRVRNELILTDLVQATTDGRSPLLLTGSISSAQFCLPEIIALLEAHRIRTEVRDERFVGTPIDVEFRGGLRPLQLDAVSKITQRDEGILCAPTAFGKTAVAAWLIAKRKVNTLVMVHRQQLLDQWHERLAMFLNLPAKSIEQIGGGKMDRTGRVDIAVIQSLYRKEEVKDFVAEYGQVIVDECHHISAFTFEQVMKQVKAKYVVGLTATPTRKDGHHPIIYMQCGPARFSMSARTMTETNPFEHKVVPRHTEFRTAPEITEITIQDVYAALVDDAARNEMIAADLLRAVHAGRSPLLLTGRTEHLQYVAAKLDSTVKHVFVLKGGMGKKQRRATAEALAFVPGDEPRVILATGSYIGEGFDDARLDTLFLAMPISWKGTLQQYVGRLHRLHDNKQVVQVYDYVDDRVPMLARMYERRLKCYNAIGYTISQEAPESLITAPQVS